MSQLSIKKVFKQHNSLVVTLPWWFRTRKEIQRGDYLVFEENEKSGQVKVYKWHRGVERSYADYGHTNIRDQGGRK